MMAISDLQEIQKVTSLNKQNQKKTLRTIIQKETQIENCSKETLVKLHVHHKRTLNNNQKQNSMIATDSSSEVDLKKLKKKKNLILLKRIKKLRKMLKRQWLIDFRTYQEIK